MGGNHTALPQPKPKERSNIMINETTGNVKVELFKTWMGYEIATDDPYRKGGHLFVKRVYGGEVTWVSDYTHAKKYKSKRTAEAVAKKIKNGEVR